MKTLALVYGIFSYLVFLGTFLYGVCFMGNFDVPTSLDTGEGGPIGAALLIDLGLLILFALQHSVMARQGFKKWWTRIIPPAVERSTYVLLSSLVLLILYWLWRPIPAVIWQVDHPAVQLIIWLVFGLGWLIALAATFTLNHFDLFGLRQVYLCWRGLTYTPLPFRTPGLYRFVRHPIMLGFLIAFWAAPLMTVGHLLFAVVTTGYVLLALILEERDLVNFFGDTYRQYQKRVPKILPGGRAGQRKLPG